MFPLRSMHVKFSPWILRSSTAMLVCGIELQCQSSSRLFCLACSGTDTLVGTEAKVGALRLLGRILVRIQKMCFEYEIERKGLMLRQEVCFLKIFLWRTFCTSGSKRNKVETRLSSVPLTKKKKNTMCMFFKGLPVEKATGEYSRHSFFLFLPCA